MLFVSQRRALCLGFFGITSWGRGERGAERTLSSVARPSRYKSGHRERNALPSAQNEDEPSTARSRLVSKRVELEGQRQARWSQPRGSFHCPARTRVGLGKGVEAECAAGWRCSGVQCRLHRGGCGEGAGEQADRSFLRPLPSSQPLTSEARARSASLGTSSDGLGAAPG